MIDRASLTAGLPRFRPLYRRARRRPGLVFASLVLALVVLWTLVPTWFAPDDPNQVDTQNILRPPSWSHLFGTDNLGRDVYSRVVHGASLTVEAALLAVGLALVVGGVAGAVAGSLRGWPDDVIMRCVDAMMAIPALLLAMAIVMALGFGTVHVAVAIGVAEAGVVARVMRAEVLRVRGEYYVDAAYASGMHWPGILFRHILPNSRGPVLALAMLQLGLAVLAIASLSFLGFGSPPPAPEWGTLISEGRGYLSTAWWMTTFPGVTVAVVVLAANRVARSFEAQESTDLTGAGLGGLWMRKQPRAEEGTPAANV